MFMAFSTALVAGNSSPQMAFVDDYLKKNRMENASRASFLRSSFQVSEVYSSWQPHGHYYLQLLSHYANMELKTQATASKPLIK